MGWGKGFPGGSVVKNLPAKQETQVRSLGQEDPLEKEMATQSNILAWKIPWMEEPGRLLSMRWQRVRHNLATKQQKQWGEKWTVTHGVYNSQRITKLTPGLWIKAMPSKEDSLHPLKKKFPVCYWQLQRQTAWSDEFKWTASWNCSSWAEFSQTQVITPGGPSSSGPMHHEMETVPLDWARTEHLHR